MPDHDILCISLRSSGNNWVNESFSYADALAKASQILGPLNRTAFFKVVVAFFGFSPMPDSLFQAAFGIVKITRSGFSITAPIGVQLRVRPDQRPGFNALAAS